MADEEQPGFTVVDRRRAAQETASSVPDPNQAHAHSSTASSDFPAPTQEQAPTEFTPSVDSDAPDASGEPGATGLPDPAMILSLAALQMDTHQLMTLLLPIFDGQAWQGLGLIANPLTGQTGEDLPAAQLAIDAVQFLLSKLESDMPDAERREARRRLNDLRMNYLAKRSGSSSDVK